MRKIYVATSWRNVYQPLVVDLLRSHGHQVYDFRNPSVGYENPTGAISGFRWEIVDSDWEHWDVNRYRYWLYCDSSIEKGFQSDWLAMKWADTCVLVLPSGKSAHLEAGYFVGAGKELHILLMDYDGPDLMYRMATEIHIRPTELITALNRKVEPWTPA